MLIPPMQIVPLLCKRTEDHVKAGRTLDISSGVRHQQRESPDQIEQLSVGRDCCHRWCHRLLAAPHRSQLTWHLPRSDRRLGPSDLWPGGFALRKFDRRVQILEVEADLVGKAHRGKSPAGYQAIDGKSTSEPQIHRCFSWREEASVLHSSLVGSDCLALTA